MERPLFVNGCGKPKSEPSSKSTPTTKTSHDEQAKHDHEGHDDDEGHDEHAAHDHGGWWCAAHGVPELILVELTKAKCPISYANAFLKPVNINSGNLMVESAKALA